jgi:hypothetical protein
LAPGAVEESRKKLFEKLGIDPITKDELELKTGAAFFDHKKNALVRSFRAVEGKGLAGVITSMNLNYDGATWGTAQEHSDRAPKQVEISLGFAPIHDLPLGLDSHGELVAPSHPVGSTFIDLRKTRT